MRVRNNIMRAGITITCFRIQLAQTRRRSTSLTALSLPKGTASASSGDAELAQLSFVHFNA